MAKFEKGKPKTGGRTKGSKNKATSENRERVNKVISHLYDEYLFDDLENIGASERVKTLIALMEYSLPKLQRIAHEGQNQAPIQVEVVFDSTNVKPIESESDIKD